MLASLVLSAALSANEIYLKAIARLQSLPQSPFIEYRMEQTSTDPDGGNRFSLDELVIERRSDHTSWNTVLGGDAPLHGVLIGRHYLVPDMLLHSTDVSSDAASAMPQLDRVEAKPADPKVILTVYVIAKPQYTVTSSSDVTLPGCGGATHLMLAPKGDSDRYNVREMWIRPTDFVLCQIRYNSKLFSVRHQDTSSTLDVTAQVDENGMVTSWTDKSHVFLPLPGFDSVGSGKFSRFLWTSEEPDYFFDEIMWTKHANEVKAQATPHVF